MLSSLANYLLRSSVSGAQNSREDNDVENVDIFPIAARLRQVEVEGNDWILIDRTGNFINQIPIVINLMSSSFKFCYK